MIMQICSKQSAFKQYILQRLRAMPSQESPSCTLTFTLCLPRSNSITNSTSSCSFFRSRNFGGLIFFSLSLQQFSPAGLYSLFSFSILFFQVPTFRRCTVFSKPLTEWLLLALLSDLSRSEQSSGLKVHSSSSALSLCQSLTFFKANRFWYLSFWQSLLTISFSFILSTRFSLFLLEQTKLSIVRNSLSSFSFSFDCSKNLSLISLYSSMKLTSLAFSLPTPIILSISLPSVFSALTFFFSSFSKALQYWLFCSSTLQVSTNSTTASSSEQTSPKAFLSSRVDFQLSMQMISLSSLVSTSSSSIIFHRQQTNLASSLSRLFSNSPFSNLSLADSILSMIWSMPVRWRMGMLVSMLMSASSWKGESCSVSLLASMRLLCWLIFLEEERWRMCSCCSCVNSCWCCFFHFDYWYRFQYSMAVALFNYQNLLINLNLTRINVPYYTFRSQLTAPAALGRLHKHINSSCRLYCLQIKYQRYMSQPNACSFEFEDDLEEIPNEFEENKPTPFSYYNSSKLHSNITLTKPLEKDVKKSQITQYLHKTQQYLHNKTQKISLLKDQMEHRIMTVCTFKPSINKSRSKSARNIKQFLDSQQKHLDKIEEKKEILKERLQQQNRKNMTFSPTINHSKSYKNKENVHQRLYKQRDKDEKSDNYYQTFSHMPKITSRGQKVVRNMPVGELLYQDAKRRADRQYQLPQTQERITQKNHIQQKYAAQKFLKDYKNALCHTNLQQKTQYNQEDFTKIMVQLGYARYSAIHNHSLYQQQKKLLQDCFSYLQQAGVTQINFYVFLLALSGIYGIDLNNEEITGVLVLDQEEGKKIHQYFDLLFRNRLFADVSRKEQKTFVKDQNHFKPSINPGSQAMAQKYRYKMIEKANSIFSKNNIDIQINDKGITHQDLLVICNLGQNLEKQKLRQRKMEEKDPECTFQPNSQKYSLQFTNSSIGKDKCKQLYENAKAKQEEIQKLATFRTFQQKKNLKNDLHSPRPNNKNSSSISKSNIKSYLEIKDVDKTLARMVAGRQQRNQKRQLEQRGERIPKKMQQKCKKSTEKSYVVAEKELLLDADIMVNNSKKKIYIYRGEQNKVNEIVQKFAIQCELDEYSRNVLQEKLIESIRCLKQEQHSIIDTSF